MNKCKDFRVMISRRLDHDLDVSRQQLLRSHMDSCAACREASADYAALTALLSESYAVHSAGTDTVPAHTSRAKPFFPFHSIQWAARFAVILAAGISVYLVSAKLHKPAKATVLVWQESLPVMNSPLGAMVYYENFAGKAIHAQFAKIRTRPISSFAGSSITGISYGSPLFEDDSVLLKRDQLVANW